MTNLKICRKDFSIFFDSFEEVSRRYAEELGKLPKEATNITSSFEIEEEYGSTRPVLEISYYMPKTEAELMLEARQAELDRARKLEIYLKLKSEFKDD
jgi:hypothetical protein